MLWDEIRCRESFIAARVSCWEICLVKGKMLCCGFILNVERHKVFYTSFMLGDGLGF